MYFFIIEETESCYETTSPLTRITVIS